MDQIGNELKRILMAGLGAVSVSFEKAQEIINTLAKKGEITYEQAKILSDEVTERIKKAVDKSGVKEAFTCKGTQETIIRDLEDLTFDERAAIRKAIDDMEMQKEESYNGKNQLDDE